MRLGHAVFEFFLAIIHAFLKRGDTFAHFAHQAGNFTAPEQDQNDNCDQKKAGKADVIEHDFLLCRAQMAQNIFHLLPQIG